MIGDHDNSDQESQSHLSAKDQTKNSTHHGNIKNSSVASSRDSNVGESQAEEKDEYIKAIFEVIKIDRKTRKTVKRSKKRHIISHCEHIYAKYYAKGMCKKCYFSKGQTKKMATK